MTKLVGFDFDGTLVQSNAIKVLGFHQVAERLGDVSDVVKLALASVKGDRTAIFRFIVEQLDAAGRLPSPEDDRPWVDALVERYTAFCEEAITACPEIPGAMQALRRLAGLGHILFVNSATPPAPLAKILERRNMSGHFRLIYGNDGSKVENIRRALSETGCGPDELVFVGDNEADRKAAEEIGCPFIGLINEFSGYRQAPGYPIADLTGLEQALAFVKANRGKTATSIGKTHA